MGYDFDAIRRDHPLESVVSKVVPLRRAGGNKVACCPFHADRSPSFVVYKDENYHCFGCGAHGDVIDFIAQSQNLQIEDAIRYLTGGEAPKLNAEDQERRAREAREQKAKQQAREESARQDAQARWARALPINGEGNTYLERKGVAPYGTRREGDNLLVPIYGDAGQIISVQSIPPEPGGKKLFHAGAPVKGGTFTLGESADGPIVVVEGFATGATVQAATGNTVIVGFSKGALKRTAQIAARRYPGREIIIGADTNGVEEAEEAAAAVGGRVVVPDLQGAEGSDFNDQAMHYGTEDVGLLFATLPPIERDAPPLPLIWFDDNQPLLTGNWIVKNVLPANAFATIIGHPGCGKSFLALDLALHIAAGVPWQGRKVRKGLVLYLAAEGQRGQQNRVEAWKRHYNAQGLAFAMIPVGVNLRDREADLPKLFETVQAALHHVGVDLSVLVVDTLNRTFGGGDENGTDMSDYVENVGRIQNHFGCTVIVVHHIPKNSETVSERGHGSLRGAIETSLVVSSDAETGIRTVLCKKQKDAEDGWKAQFKLKVVELGHDEDGDEVTSCVVIPTDEPQAQRGAGPTLTGTQRQAHNELLATLEACPVASPRDFPDEMRGRIAGGKITTRTAWMQRWMAIAGGGKPEESAKATFRRAVTDLQNKGLVGAWNDFVWAVNL